MSAPLPVARTARHDPLQRALGGLAVLIVTWYGLDLGGPVVQIRLCWAGLTVLQAMDLALAVAVARSPGPDRAVRRFWWHFALALALFGTGSVWELGRSLAVPSAAATGSSVFQLATLATGGLVIVASMLAFPLGLSGARERRRYWLDAATVMVGAMVFAWCLGRPTSEAGAASGGTGPGSALVRSLVGPGLFVVIGFGLLKLVTTRRPPFTRRGAAFAVLAAALESLSTGLDHALVAAGHTSWSTALGMTANVALAAGMRSQQRQLRGDAEPLPMRAERPFSRLPYTAVAATYALLVHELWAGALSSRAWVVLVGAMTSTLLVVLRQLAAFANNAALLRSLDAKIAELDAAHAAMQQALAERDALARRLRHQATHDDLTGLATRALFVEQVEAALARARRTGAAVGLLMIDLNDFKPVNDRLGHHAGDLVLQHVAARMTAAVREVDAVARLGGDEFAILLETGKDARAAADRVGEAVRSPVVVDGQQVVVGASIGVVTTDGGTHTAESLLQEADVRMYRVKSGSKIAARGATAR